MTKLLSDEKIEQLFKSMHGFPYPNDLYAFARAIEAAVLEAQGKQEPWPFSADRVTYHKAAPVVQPDTVLVPREPTEAMLRAMEKQWMYGSQEDMAKREYRAMIAACEDKS